MEIIGLALPPPQPLLLPVPLPNVCVPRGRLVTVRRCRSRFLEFFFHNKEECTRIVVGFFSFSPLVYAAVHISKVVLGAVPN